MNLFDIQQKDFIQRHLGPNESETALMLERIGVKSTEELMDITLAKDIRLKKELHLPEEQNEFQYLENLKKIANKNKQYKTYIGQGYYDTITPSPILRNVFENPGWYTSY